VTDLELYGDDWSWLRSTRFGSGIARMLVCRATECGEPPRELGLNYPKLVDELEFTEKQLRAAVDRLVRHGHARIDPVDPKGRREWSEGTEYVLVILTPDQLRHEAREREIAEARAAAKEKRRQEKIAARGGVVNRRTIPVVVKARVYARDGFACRKCGATEDLSIDHVQPWSLGGSDEIENLQILCRPCNSGKGDRS
jgi:hypothetical protein